MQCGVRTSGRRLRREKRNRGVSRRRREERRGVKQTRKETKMEERRLGRVEEERGETR